MKQKVNKNLKNIVKMFSVTPQTTLGINKINFLDAEKGVAELIYNAKKNMCHSKDIVQGGFITGWLDAAMAIACMCKVGEDVLVLSLEIKTTFLKSVNPGPVTVIGRVIKAGKSIAFLEGELRDNENILLAKANQTAKLKYNFYK
tara:strand:- start:27 stop:461 length:435 start_codon:yes stop_codon:yes gene_type:complete